MGDTQVLKHWGLCVELTPSFVPDLFSPSLEITSHRAHVHVHRGFGRASLRPSKLAYLNFS